jgi:hypothetical protein
MSPVHEAPPSRVTGSNFEIIAFQEGGGDNVRSGDHGEKKEYIRMHMRF